MPPRWFCLAIVVFWLSTTTWLFWQEIVPLLADQAPPPFHIDLVDEVQQKAIITWDFFAEEERTEDDPAARTFLARSWVEYREKPDDSFAFHLQFEPRGSQTGRMQLGPCLLKRMNSHYRVNRTGQLLAMEADFAFDIPGFSNIAIQLQGQVRDGRFHTHIRASQPQTGTFQHDLEPVPFTQRSSMMLPLHPLNRIMGLRAGQTWRIPLANPFEEALASLNPFGRPPGVRYLDARVLQPQPLPRRTPEVLCLVIDYDEPGVEEEKKVHPRTWVQLDSGHVLRQEATVLGRRLVMQRETIPDNPP